MVILSSKVADIIRKDTGFNLHQLGTRSFNPGPSYKKIRYANRARGSVRAMFNRITGYQEMEQRRRDLKKLRLGQKSKGIQKLLRHFR